jgi:glycosyltransferase involved in cell wall biosynthesis
MSNTHHAPAAPALAVYVPHLRQGGGEISMLRLASGLARGGLPVQLLVHSLAGAELPPPPGLGVVELGAAGTLGNVRRLAQWLQQARPRWLASAFPHTNVAAVAAVQMAGRRCHSIVSEHAPLSLQIRRQGTLRYRVLPPLVRWAYPRAAAVVAVSAGVRQDLLGLVGPGLAPRLHTIANPVLDAAPAANAAAGTPLHPWLLDSSLRVVLSVSRLSPEKDIPSLLQAFARVHRQLPQTRLLLAGDGPERAHLARLIEHLGLGTAAQLAGRVQQPQAWMQRAAVFALASQYEGFGNVLVEALASGCPVVATDCPVGPREILEDGRWGSLVPVGDVAALAGQIQSLVAAPPTADLRVAAVAHAQRYTDEAACSAWRRLLEHLP